MSTKKVTTEKLSPEAALSAYNGMNLNELTKAARDLTKQDSDSTVMRRVASICHRAGVQCRKFSEKVTEERVGELYEQFADGWYYKGAGGKREPLEKSSRDALLSAYQGFGVLGRLPYDSSPIMVAIMAGKDRKGKPLSATQQGGKARKFAKSHPTKAPTPKELADGMKASKASRNSGRKAQAAAIALADLLSALATAWENVNVQTLASESKTVGGNLRAIFACGADLKDALASSEALKGEPRKTALDTVKVLTKAAAAIPHKATT